MTILPKSWIEPEGVRRFVETALNSSPSRLVHVLEIARRVRESAALLNRLGWHPPIDLEIAECAALLHDIGYWKPIAETGFHPVDGLRFLYGQGQKELGELIAGHSCSPEEGMLSGFPGIEPSPNIIARLITYWDLQVKQGGEVVSYQERLRDILSRYGPDTIVAKANLAAQPRLEALMQDVSTLLNGAPR